MEGDVSALFIYDKVTMRRLVIICLFFEMLVSLTANGQKKVSDDFLNAMFSISQFRIGSMLTDIKKHEGAATQVDSIEKRDDEDYYILKNQQTNLPGLKALDKLQNNKLLLIFRDKKLVSVESDIRRHFEDGIFNRTVTELEAKYGPPQVSYVEDSPRKKYVWSLGKNEIVIEPVSSSYFKLKYELKRTRMKNIWIYKDRKGEGDGTIRLNLHYLEEQLSSSLTVASFEKLLPKWETNGALNHIRYELNFRTMVDNTPIFAISYSLNDYKISIQTVDTISKSISQVTFEKIKDINLIKQFKKDLENSNYEIRPPRYSDEDLIDYRKKNISVFLMKDNSQVTILKY